MRRVVSWLPWLLALIASLIIIGLPLWQSVPLWSDTAFRSGFLGNWSATMLGAIVGIPIALALNRLWQREQERAERKKADAERAEREKFILSLILQRRVGDAPHPDAARNRWESDGFPLWKAIRTSTLVRLCVVILIRNELRENKGILLHMIESQAVEPGVYPIAGMKNVNWEVLSNTGELRWITDLSVLHHLSEAYYHINALINLEMQFLSPEFDTTPVRTVHDRTRFRGSARIVAHVHNERPEALRRVEDAIKVIDQKIGGDLTFSDGTQGDLPKTFVP